MYFKKPGRSLKNLKKFEKTSGNPVSCIFIRVATLPGIPGKYLKNFKYGYVEVVNRKLLLKHYLRH